jgi:hypothetical protein
MLENPSIYKAFVSEHGKNVFNGVKYVVCFNKSKGVKGIKGSCFKYFKTYEIKGIIRENGIWKSNEIKEKYLSVFGNDSDYKEHVLKNVPLPILNSFHLQNPGTNVVLKLLLNLNQMLLMKKKNYY